MKVFFECILTVGVIYAIFLKRFERDKMNKQFLKDELDKLLAINDKFSKWENAVLVKINKGRLLSIKILEMIKRTPIDWDTLWIISSIGAFTMNNNVENFEHCLKDAQKVGAIKGFERKKIGYSLIAKDDAQIRFFQLTDFIPSLDDNVKERLHSPKRFGHCHWDSIHLSEHLQMPNRVVSALCTAQSKKMQYPHSWVELEYKGKEWVLDFTMNDVMNKEGFYKLYNPQKIVSIDNSTLIEDIKLMKKTSLRYDDIRMYLFHPDEAREVMQEEIKSQKAIEDNEHPWIMTY